MARKESEKPPVEVTGRKRVVNPGYDEIIPEPVEYKLYKRGDVLYVYTADGRPLVTDGNEMYLDPDLQNNSLKEKDDGMLVLETNDKGKVTILYGFNMEELLDVAEDIGRLPNAKGVTWADDRGQPLTRVHEAESEEASQGQNQDLEEGFGFDR